MKSSRVQPRSLKEKIEDYALSTLILEDSGHNYFQYLIVLFSEIQIIALFIHFSFHFFEDNNDPYLTFLKDITGFLQAEMIYSDQYTPNFDGAPIAILIFVFYTGLVVTGLITAYHSLKKKHKIVKRKLILSNIAFFTQQILFIPIYAVLLRICADFYKGKMKSFGNSQSIVFLFITIWMLVSHGIYVLLSSFYNLHPFHNGNLLGAKSTQHFALTLREAERKF